MSEDQIGYHKFTPAYGIDHETGGIIVLDIPADAVSQKAKPGVKAGSPFLDELLDEQILQGLLTGSNDHLYRRY